jgi:arylsulfatase A-like enzyme
MKPAQRNSQPNVLILVMDATRADHLSCYGYRRRTTPNLERVAAQGVLYDQCVSPAVWTLPSMASLFTGLHVSQHGTTFDHQYLEPRFVTLAQVLQRIGYRTALFSAGGWVSETFGMNRGFDTFRNYTEGSPRLPRFFRTTVPVKRIRRRVRGYLGLGGKHDKSTLSITRDLRQWLERDRQPAQPFFAVAHFANPHWPYLYHPQFSWVDDGRNLPARCAPEQMQFIAGQLTLTEEELALMVDYYDGEIAFLDHHIGDTLDGLQVRGHLDDTLVVITADHGEHLGDHGLMGHTLSVYEGLVHVPLILHHPDHFAGGRRVSEPVQTVDLFTTILDMLGLDRGQMPNSVLGRSLEPERVHTEPRSIAVSEYLAPHLKRLRRVCPGFDVTPFDRQLRALRTRDGRHKLIWSSDGRHELYNLADDPGEMEDLADLEVGRARELLDRLQSWLGELEAAEFDHLEPEMEQVLVERLRDLGYL